MGEAGARPDRGLGRPCCLGYLILLLLIVIIHVVVAHQSSDSAPQTPGDRGWWHVSSAGTTWHQHDLTPDLTRTAQDDLDDLKAEIEASLRHSEPSGHREEPIPEPVQEPVLGHRRNHQHKVRHGHDKRRRHVDNQHVPRFTHSEYQQSVREDVQPGTSILRVHATDDDQDLHGLIRYTVSDPEHFRVDEGGVVYNIKPLDYEHTNGEYVLQVAAEDQGVDLSERRRAIVPVRLRVIDTPDAPEFDQTSYHFTVSELAGIDAYVGTVVARDEDNDFDSYSLQGVTPPGMFNVEPNNGMITVGLDGFGDTWEFMFQAVATDKRGQSRSVEVKVTVRDENTNKPVFPDCDTYNNAVVSENSTAGTVVLQVQATDKDHGVNGQVTYSLLNDFDNSFAIDTVNGKGQITTKKALDRDTTDKEFYMTVVAKDGAPNDMLQETCSFRLVVQDINDNPPIFDQSVYMKRIPTDHQVEMPVLRVTATDMDIEDNALITYSLQGPQSDLEYFRVDQDSGFIYLKKALSDSMADQKIFSLTASAVDKGIPPMSSNAPVTIDVVASGKQPPSIESQNPTNPTVKEDAEDQTPVVTVCARSNVENDRVDFTLLNGNTADTNEDGTFDIRRLEPSDSTTCPDGMQGGVIYVAIANLDYETITTYKLILEVVNSEYSRADHQIIVNVQDVNDNPPLPQPFDGAVMENAEPGLITILQAVDKDASEEFRRLTFSFGSSTDPLVKERFRLRENGELSTLLKLDREEKPNYRIPVTVSDGNSAHSKTRVYWVTVQDENDVAPVFSDASIKEVELPENTEVGRNTGIRLDVIDPDVVNYNEFQIVSGNDQSKFRIDATTGDVLVNYPLDYDQPSNDRNFTLKVRLSDGRNNFAETDIVLAVQNVNDQRPVFGKTQYDYTLTENEQCDQQFGQVSAVDPDLPATADQNIQFFLADTTNFTIGETDGMLTINGCLDREAATRGQISVYPSAVDMGGQGLFAEPATVTITIRDINDNHPFIQSPDQSRTMFMENVEPGSQGQSVVIMLNDLDSQEEGNGCPCTLTLAPDADPSIAEKFDVHAGNTESQYVLAPKVRLDREQQKVYRVPFITRDNKGRSGVRILTVDVGDVNDSPMTDGESAISVYNYQGQFPDVVIGSVYVTDADDYDVADKTFELSSTSPHEPDTFFIVNVSNGNITMVKGTPAGDYTLEVKVRDSNRNETAVGVVHIRVVDLTEEAVRQSGSFRIANLTAHQLLQGRDGGDSLYQLLKGQLASIHGIAVANVDVFSLRDVAEGVDVRYNCHGSPYFTAPRLNGLLLAHRDQVMKDLGIDIPMVDINSCLYEATSPCGEASCQHQLRPNMTWPLVVAADTSTMVGVDIADEYSCHCSALEPRYTVCYEGYCLNGGTCLQINDTVSCDCPDKFNYGPRCELLNARFKHGFAWYEAPNVCDNSTLFMSFESHDPQGVGVLLYAGPTVERPWEDYPRDFLYVVLQGWTLRTFLDLGTGTASLDIPLERSTDRAFDYSISWGDGGITFAVANCLGNASSREDLCRKTLPLQGAAPSVLLNTPGPLQVGGMAAMPPLEQIAASYGWTIKPPTVNPFYGCVLELRYNDHLYDLNSTDYAKSTFQPCDAPETATVILGQESIIIIVISLLLLLLGVLLILCLARRGRKTISHPELDGIVKETIGGTDLEGYGEKDMTTYDLKLLRVGPDGHLFNDIGGFGTMEDQAMRGTPITLHDGTRRPPDVVDDRRQTRAPLALMPEGLSIGDFIDDNIKKVDRDPADFDDVRHYCFEGDEMSIASLSSIESGGSSDSGGQQEFDYMNDWGPRFQKLNQIYKRDSDEEDDSEFDFPAVPKGRKRDTLPQAAPKADPTAPRTPDEPVPTGRPRDGPSVTFAPDTQGSREATGQQDFHEAGIDGSESWC